MENDKVVISKEEYEDLQSNYDKIYEQAEADILANMANGGASCHWCIDKNREQARKEMAKEIIDRLSGIKSRIKELGIDFYNSNVVELFKRIIKEIAEKYGVEIEQ